MLFAGWEVLKNTYLQNIVLKSFQITFKKIQNECLAEMHVIFALFAFVCLLFVCLVGWLVSCFLLCFYF